MTEQEQRRAKATADAAIKMVEYQKAGSKVTTLDGRTITREQRLAELRAHRATLG